MTSPDATHVRLSAENMTLRQRVAQLEKANQQLRDDLGHRTTIADTVMLRVIKED